MAMNETHASGSDQNALCNRALDAELSGRLDDAVADYIRAVRLDARNPVPLLYLGHAYALQGREENAAAAWSLAADRNPRVINAWRGKVREDIATRSKAADQAIRHWFTQLHRHTLAQFAREHASAEVGRIEHAVWVQTHDEPVSFQDPAQQPHVFYVPSLAPIAVFDHTDAPWLATLEAAFDEIRDEYLSACDAVQGALRPYLDWEIEAGYPLAHLAQNRAWTALHLYKQSVPNPEVIARFPRTVAALRKLPLLEVDGHPREVLFSVLAGGEHIKPHYGLANTDATVHLPLLVPGAAALRVGDEIYHWEAGKALAFDDSFLHESWNRGEESRVTLLFEAWHPDLSVDERRAVQASFEGRDRWNGQRSRLALG